MRKASILALALSFFVFIVQCDRDDDDRNGSGEQKESTHASTESHNMGKDCMQCHDGSDREAPHFTVAGTVYKTGGQETAPNGYVTLYTDANGQGNMVLRLEVDGRGNFYTTRAIDWGGGLYPVAEGANGNQSMMPISITRGNCNSCHTDSGNPTNRIEI